MASPGQKMGLCGHLMAGFDSHTYCAHYRDKNKGDDPCVKNMDCKYCNSLCTEQKPHLSTPSYQDKKKKCEQKSSMQESDSTLVEPLSVTVIGVASYVGNSSNTPAKVDKKHENSVESEKKSKSKKAGTSVSKGSGRNDRLKTPNPPQTLN